MKLIAIAPAIVLLITLSHAADAPHPDLEAARKRYEASVAAATKPVREKYISELEQLKNRAMAMKNLELAIAIDQELKALRAPGASAPVVPPKLSSLLPDSTWLPEENGYYKSVSFTKDGKIRREPKSGTEDPVRYEIEQDGDTISFKREDGATLRAHFSKNRRTFQMNNITYKRSEP